MASPIPDKVRPIVRLIERWLDYQTYIRQIPGVAVGISVGDETLLARGFGYSNLESRRPVSADTRFRIASHSKVFTATAIMQLAEQGRLSLDDPVSAHLDWFRSDHDDNLEHVTVRQLLTHSSGLSRDGDTGHWLNDRFPENAEIVRQVTAGASVFSTNEHLKYSNFAYTIAGRVIAAVTATTYEDHVTATLLAPLGLEATTPDLPAAMASHATGYTKRFPDRPRRPLPHVPANIMNSATGFSSTVSDLLRWYQAHLPGNGLLLSDWSKREMQRLQFEDRTYRWGLGFAHMKVAELDFVGHGGGYPGFITRSALDREHRLAIVVLTNAIDGPATTLFDGIAKLLAKALAPEDLFAGDLTPASVDRFMGFYASRWQVQLFEHVAGTLVAVDPDTLDPTEEMEIYEHSGDLRFRVPTTLALGRPGEESWFEEVAGAPRLAFPGGFMERFEFSY